MPPVILFLAIAFEAIGLPSFAALVAAEVLVIGGGMFVLGEVAKIFNPQKGIRGPAVTPRQPIAPRQCVYGLARVGGIVTFMDTKGANNKFLELVITLTGHQVNAIPTMYFDGVAVNLNGSGNSTTAPWLDKHGNPVVHAEFNLGTRDAA